MSSSHDHTGSRRNRLRSGLFAGLLLSVFTLGGCGFEPLYSSDSSINEPDVMDELGKIKVSTIPNRQGVNLRNALLIRINPNGEPVAARYRLDVSYSQVREDYGRRRDGTTGQRRYRMIASYTLREGNKVLFQGSSLSYASYGVLDQEFATTVAERNAEERGSTDLAEDIRLKLASYFKGVTKPKNKTAASTAFPEAESVTVKDKKQD